MSISNAIFIVNANAYYKCKFLSEMQFPIKNAILYTNNIFIKMQIYTQNVDLTLKYTCTRYIRELKI